jgi:nucleotide-binding universal stress UspA family protein
MEFTLPDEYKEEEELEKQRKIHDALIARGLHLISDSYLDQMGALSEEKGINFERKHFDGRNFEALVGDIQDDDYDLVVLGALGQGAVRDSQVGSVCERILRRTAVDTLVIRNPDVSTFDAAGPIAVALDGSPHAYGALQGAISLAKVTGKTIEVVAALGENPTENTLLEAHLGVAQKLVERAGITVTTKTLNGPAIDALVAYAAEAKPWALALGRIGIDQGSDDIGSTTDNLIRKSPANLLVASQVFSPVASKSDAATASAK